jgi:hypothetical protein
MKKTYELINRNFEHVIVKENNNLMEISIELDHSSLKIEKINYRLMMNLNDNLARWHSEDGALNYVSIESLNDAKKLLRKNVRNLKVKLNDAKLNPAYVAMSEYAEEIIKHYKADFTFHDAIQLMDHSVNDKFVWIVRECGSHLFYNPSSWSNAIFDQQKKNSEKNLCFLWDGQRLINVSLDDGQNMLEKIGKYTFIAD